MLQVAIGNTHTKIDNKVRQFSSQLFGFFTFGRHSVVVSPPLLPGVHRKISNAVCVVCQSVHFYYLGIRIEAGRED